MVRRIVRAVREGRRRKVIRPSRRPPARIVIGSSVVADYPEGGGVWSWYLQYLLGLRALGYDAIGIELLDSTGDPGEDERRIRAFFRRFAEGIFDEDDLRFRAKELSQFIPAAALNEFGPQRGGMA